MPLGRGLSSLIPPKIQQEIKTKSKEVIDIPVDSIFPNPKQPREQFNHQELEELIESVKEHGIIQPLLVSDIGGGKFELIAGERRLRAAKIAGLQTAPAIVKQVKDQEKLELALIENIQRQNLNPIEEAKAYKYLNEALKLTHEEIAKRIGKSRPLVTNTLRLLELPPEIQKAVIGGKIQATAARQLAGLTETEQKKYLGKILSENWTVRSVEARTGAKKPAKLVLSDANTKAEEENLRNALGTKVTIQKSGGKGKIIIEFYSDEDRVNLIKKLLKVK
jgi:ParB family chromosome partitioning protein